MSWDSQEGPSGWSSQGASTWVKKWWVSAQVSGGSSLPGQREPDRQQGQLLSLPTRRQATQ